MLVIQISVFFQRIFYRLSKLFWRDVREAVVDFWNSSLRREEGDTGSANTLVRRVGEARVTTVFGEAVTRNGRKREAHQRSEAQRHRSNISASGPIPLDLSIDFNLLVARSDDGDPRDTTHPPTRRPFKDIRTREPSTTTSVRDGGTR